MAELRQLDTKQDIVGQVLARSGRLAKNLIRKRHPGARQLAGQAELAQTGRTDLVSDDHGQRRPDGPGGGRLGRGKYDVSLNGAFGADGLGRDALDRFGRDPAVGIDNDDDIRRGLGKVLDGKHQRIGVAPGRHLLADDPLHAGLFGDLHCAVCARRRDDENGVVFAVGFERLEARRKVVRFTMSGNQNDRLRTGAARVQFEGTLGQQGGQAFDDIHRHRNEKNERYDAKNDGHQTHEEAPVSRGRTPSTQVKLS